MAASNRPPPRPADASGWKQKLFVGVEIPLPWLVTITFALFFNAGILYQQLSALLSETAKFNKSIEVMNDRVNKMEQQDLRNSDRSNNVDTRLADHEIRLRNIERLNPNAK